MERIKQAFGEAFAVQKIKHTLEIYPGNEAVGVVYGVFIWNDDVRYVETKRCKVTKSVTLSNGQMRIRVHVYNIDISIAEISRVAREVLHV